MHLHHRAVLLLVLYLVPTYCLRCPSGTFQASNNSCQICPPGTWRNARDIFRPREAPCIPCGSGVFNPAAGAVGVDLCRRCRPNTFSDTPRATSCKPCPAGLSSNYRATKCIRCGPGTRISMNSKRCVPCEGGFYSSESNNRKCLRCPVGLRSPRGASSKSQCRPCPPGKQAYRAMCEACNPGLFKPGRDGHCETCPRGTFSDQEGATMCKPCPPGTFRYLGDGCRRCKAGRTAVGFGNVSCRVRGSPCKKTLFEDSNGACRACETGYRLNHSERNCEKCPPGTVSPGGVQTICIPCTNGTLPDIWNSSCGCLQGKFPDRRGGCVPCPPGQYNPNVRPASPSCFSCDPGTFSNKPGATRCKKCPLGQVAPLDEATSCTPCPKGTLPDPEKSSEAVQCVSQTTRCPLGFRRTFVGASNSFFRCRRVTCTLDTDKRDIGKTCAPCQPGTFLDNEKRRCLRCRFDEFSLGGLVTRCKKCPDGKFQDDSDGSMCNCKGFRAEGKGIQDGVCKRCPPGSFGEFESAFCMPCPPGTFANKKGMFRCEECPVDRFNDKEGASRCKKCPSGTISDRPPGGISCIPAPVPLK